MALARLPSPAGTKDDLNYLKSMEDPELTNGSSQKSAIVAALSKGPSQFKVINVELPRNDFDGELGEDSHSPQSSFDPRLEQSGSSIRAVSPKESSSSSKDKYLKDRYRQASASPKSSRRSESPRARQSNYGQVQQKEAVNIPSWMYDPALGGFNPLPARAVLHKHKRQDIKTESGKRHTTAKAVQQMKQAMDMIQHEVNFSMRGAIAGWKLSPIRSYHQNRAYGIWSQARSETTSSRPTTTQSSQRALPSRQRPASTEPSLNVMPREAVGSAMTDALSKRVYGKNGPVSPLYTPHMTLTGGHDTLSQITAHYHFHRKSEARGVTPSRPRTEGTASHFFSLSSQRNPPVSSPGLLRTQVSFTGRTSVVNFGINQAVRQESFSVTSSGADGSDIATPSKRKASWWGEGPHDPSLLHPSDPWREQPRASASSPALAPIRSATPTRLLLAAGLSGTRPLALHDPHRLSPSPSPHRGGPALVPYPGPTAAPNGTDEPYLQYLRRRPGRGSAAETPVRKEGSAEGGRVRREAEEAGGGSVRPEWSQVSLSQPESSEEGVL